jgi:hypothetical protein
MVMEKKQQVSKSLFVCFSSKFFVQAVRFDWSVQEKSVETIDSRSA